MGQYILLIGAGILLATLTLQMNSELLIPLNEGGINHNYEEEQAMMGLAQERLNLAGTMKFDAKNGTPANITNPNKLGPDKISGTDEVYPGSNATGPFYDDVDDFSVAVSAHNNSKSASYSPLKVTVLPYGPFNVTSTVRYCLFNANLSVVPNSQNGGRSYFKLMEVKVVNGTKTDSVTLYRVFTGKRG